jgi:hypothetical protein
MQRKVYILSDELSQAIDDYRFKERFKSEAEAVRYILQRGLEACVNLPQPEEKAEETQYDDTVRA